MKIIGGEQLNSDSPYNLLAPDRDTFEDLEGFITLSEAIQTLCETLAAEISAEWTDWALSEITTAGYQPNHKHGMAINITPLVEAEIVPESVDDEVV